MVFSNLTQTIMTPRLFIVACILAGALALSGCRTHKRAGTSEQENPKKPVSLEEPTDKMPSDMFKDWPAYPGAQVTHVYRPRGAMREVVFQVKGSPDFKQMTSFYKDEFKKHDFRITSSLTMAVRKTWSCDFNKEGRPGSVKLYPGDKDKSTQVIDLIYEVPSHVDQAMLAPKEEWDVIGPGRPGTVALQAPNTKVKRN